LAALVAIGWLGLRLGLILVGVWDSGVVVQGVTLGDALGVVVAAMHSFIFIVLWDFVITTVRIDAAVVGAAGVIFVTIFAVGRLVVAVIAVTAVLLLGGFVVTVVFVPSVIVNMVRGYLIVVPVSKDQALRGSSCQCIYAIDGLCRHRQGRAMGSVETAPGLQAEIIVTALSISSWAKANGTDGAVDHRVVM
jgi:hypothetical protein